jgi:hypothetical protein
MRYFLFSYTFSAIAKAGHGNLFFTSDVFPSNDMLTVEAEKIVSKTVDDITSIVITGWNEFKSKEDFNSFVGELNDQ